MNYADRHQAGRILADLLKDYAHRTDVIILALPRGGVPVAYEIATQLSLPLDVFIVRKLGVPHHVEFAMGAIASGNTVVFNEEVIDILNIKKPAIDRVLAEEQEELKRREHVYRGNKPYPDLAGKTIILVDDGIATGYSMRAALRALQKQHLAAIILAVPVAARSTCEELAVLVQKLICPLQPANFYSVGLWYDDFTQTSDEEVMQLLSRCVGLNFIS